MIQGNRMRMRFHRPIVVNNCLIQCKLNKIDSNQDSPLNLFKN